MNTEYSDVLALIKATITGDDVYISEKPKWDDIIKLLEQGRVLTVVYRTAAAINGEKATPKEYMEKWQAEAFAKGFKQLQAVYELKRVLTEAQNRKLQLIVFKGITLATLYPEPNMRCTSDADILVSKIHREEAEEMLLQLGYTKIDHLSKQHVPTYVIIKNEIRLVIELHDQLWEDYEGKQAQILASMKLDANEKLIKQYAEGIEVTTLGYNEHLIYQIFHIAKHFFFEGVPLRYIVDITLYINKYADKIDFGKVRREIRKLHYEKLYDTILKICYEYLGLRQNYINSTFTNEDLSENFISDLFEGSRIKGSVNQWETINFLGTYFMRISKTKVSTFQQRRKQVFPLPSELNSRYIYARKCPLLLPVAWIHKAFYIISYNQHCKKNGIGTTASIAKAKYRLDLMRELEITETDKEN